MKKQILSFLFVLGLGLFMANSAFAADNELKVSVGYSGNYVVSTGSDGDFTGATYTWTISPALGWKANGNTTDGQGLTTAINQTLLWTDDGSYTITVVARDANGCLSQPVSITVDVNNTLFCVDAANATNKQTCSLLTAPSNGNATGYNSNAENTAFNVTIQNPIAGVYKINYTVGGVTAQATTATAVLNTDLTHNIVVTHTSYVTQFTNTAGTNTDKNVPIVVLNIEDPNGTMIATNCGTASYNVLVYPKPIINF